MLEKMSDFFEARLEGYDAHMLTNIQSADEFYPFTARQLPMTENCAVLDLGCGTGLELEDYFRMNPYAKVTGIDLSRGMLEALRKIHQNRNRRSASALFPGTSFSEPPAFPGTGQCR